MRKADYPGSTDIWLNDTVFGFGNYSGLKYTAGHELGHVFGLDEAYIESTFTCNASRFSILDAGTRSGNTITGGCDAVAQLIPNDYNDTNSLHQLNPMTQLTSWKDSPSSMIMQFWDGTWAESGYYIYIQRWTGTGWAFTGDFWLHPLQTGWAGVYNLITWSRGPWPANYYRICGYTCSGIHGNQHFRCAPYQWLG